MGRRPPSYADDSEKQATSSSSSAKYGRTLLSDGDEEYKIYESVAYAGSVLSTANPLDIFLESHIHLFHGLLMQAFSTGLGRSHFRKPWL
eukprot:4002037-Pyramimonas_sp.AAC.1